MWKLVFLLLVVAVTELPISAQSEKVPSFERYPAKVEKAIARSIDQKRSPGASTYRTRLNRALRDGVNFAGHYVVAGWGCGTGCSNAAIIDARNGIVYWPLQFYNVDSRYGDGYSDPLFSFRPNSRLLVIHGIPGTKDDSKVPPSGDYYYEWTGNRFRLLRSVKKD